jgi:hypothetical protein
MQPRIEVINRAFAAVMANKTPAERIAIASASHRTARIILQSRVEQLYPHWTNEERHNEFLRRLLGDGTNRDTAIPR